MLSVFRRLSVLTLLALPAYALAQYPEPPAGPGPEEWPFLADLAAPHQWTFHWTRETPEGNEVSLRGGVRVVADFPDPDGLLETAYQDLGGFLAAADIPTKGAFTIVTEQAPTETFEAFEITVTEDTCRIRANDTEGIRRGIFFVEDELLRAAGPFLKIGETKRKPFIRDRISRCFFGPIKRPPKNKDELMDDVDYYPDHYLNKLAHDGVNGLWLTIEFRNICKTSLIPDVDPDREKRLAKLRATVAKCRRYGIKVFIFCIEPRVMDPDHPLLVAYPEVGSKHAGTGSKLFCPFSEASQTYLYEAVNGIFTEVPELGGLINISFGERSTTCLSSADENWKIACSTCSEKPFGEILSASLAAMEKGMHAASPDATFISWLYVPQNGTGPQRDLSPLRGIAKATPPGVICQVNFESAGTKVQLGKERHAGDYWLSYVGPSELYLDLAAGVAEGGGALGAKLQACNSFEVSTIPYVPAPGKLYEKYRAMRALGVESVMQCWYIGSLPSVMNRAAATVLPFASDDLTEEQFLLELAGRDWGPHAPTVVEAWKLFTEAYDHYPLTNAFQYYGPMHDGIGWPLHLKPVHKNLSPVWKLEYPPSGDRIGESFSGSHTMEEMLELCGRMSDRWQEGLKVLRTVGPAFANDPNRLLDLSTAEALGIHFRTGYNILRFYDRRERLLYEPGENATALLEEIRSIVEEEIENTEAMKSLCAQNPYLGFQAEAEGYQYFPAALDWRIDRLQGVLDEEIPEAARAIAAGEPVFPEQSGRTATQFHYTCATAPAAFAAAWKSDDAWGDAQSQASRDADTPSWSWQALHDADALYFNVSVPNTDAWRGVAATVHVEPTHVYPRRSFRMDPGGRRDIRTGWLGDEPAWEAMGEVVNGVQKFRLRVPLAAFQGELFPERPIRVNVEVTFLSADRKSQVVQSWVPPAEVPVAARLGYGGADPAEMGWLRRE